MAASGSITGTDISDESFLMTKINWIRIWQNVDIDSLKKHLLLVGEVSADCGACRAIGLKFDGLSRCPECGTDFKFVTSRQATGSLKSSGAAVARIKNRCSNLVFIDYEDYKAIIGKQSARDFFG